MAAARALQVVKQIQVLADGPQTPEMRACLEQVVSSLQFFLDHPDSRVRIGSARTLLKLCRGYTDAMRHIDLSKAESALSKVTADLDKGIAAHDAEELQQIMSEILGKSVETTAVPTAVPAQDNQALLKTAAMSSTAPVHVEIEERGEVVVKLGDLNTSTAKAVILDRIVNIPGSVSVTFEQDFVVIATRTKSLASNVPFLNDLFSELKSHGIVGLKLVSPSVPEFLPCEPLSKDTSVDTDTPVAISGEECEEDNDDEPSYLDDEYGELSHGFPEGAYGGGLGGGVGQWSFFSQANWHTHRRVQEYGEDPRISARLAKAKQREAEQRQEEQSRIGRIFSALSTRWLSSS